MSEAVSVKDIVQVQPQMKSMSARKVILLGLFVIALFFGGLGGWAAMAKISGAVIAPGEIIVDTNRKTVQHLEGGIVKEILVREGFKVNKGDVLIRLEAEQINATRDMYQGQLDALTIKHARLLSAIAGKAKIEWPQPVLAQKDNAKIAELMENEDKIFQSLREARLGQIDLIHTQIQQLRMQIKSLEDQMVSIQNVIESFREEIKAKNVLLQGRYIEKSHIMELDRTLDGNVLRKSQITGEIAQARQRIAELEMRIKDLENQYQQKSVAELGEAQTVIFETEERLRPISDAAMRLDITAPVSGVVVDLKVHSPGGVIGRGEPLLDIVPQDSPLIVTAKVDVRQISYISVGQQADMVLSAFKSRITPRVTGKVTYVSADRLLIQSPYGAQPYYLIHLNIDKESLRKAIDDPSLLTPGMPVEVYVQTHERPVLTYIMEPLTSVMRRSFREN